MRKKYLLVILAFVSLPVWSQRTDSIMSITGLSRDTFYMIHKNIPKSKFLGNSYYMAGSVNIARHTESGFDLGRTYGRSECGGGGCVFTMLSWGAGVATVSPFTPKRHLLSKGFMEYSLFYYPPISWTVRGEYLYDHTNNVQYVRPSAGLCLFAVDILYGYSFRLSGPENLFRHGLTIRFKYFHRTKNWQKNYPSKC